MRFFITGGAGFIGSNYIEYLIKHEKDLNGITIYDNFTYAANSKNYETVSKDSRLSVIKGDICDFDLLKKSMLDHEIVINFAAESHVDNSILNANKFIQTNITGTFNVLEASRRSGINTVIQISTDEVYGSIMNGSADENFPLLPNSPYAASKASGDLIARSYYITHGIDVRITRSCNNYGKYQFPEKIIPFFINKLLCNEKLPIYGDGNNSREWIHVSDHAHGIQTVLEKGRAGEIYNIGSGFSLTNNQVANQISEAMNIVDDKRLFVEDRKGHDQRYSVDTKKISNLGFKPQINFDQGLKETLNWYIKNPGWWNSIPRGIS